LTTLKTIKSIKAITDDQRGNAAVRGVAKQKLEEFKALFPELFAELAKNYSHGTVEELVADFFARGGTVSKCETGAVTPRSPEPPPARPLDHVELRAKAMREEGRTYREISKATGLPLGQLHRRLNPKPRPTVRFTGSNAHIPREWKSGLYRQDRYSRRSCGTELSLEDALRLTCVQRQPDVTE
jgi:hypothetical protein